MESEKVKEIKEKLQEEIFIANSFGDKLRKVPTKELEKILTLINELESENERLNSRYRNLEINYNDTWEHYREYEVENQQLKDRIAELEEYIKGNEQDAKAFVNGWHKDLETELKQFATILKVKTVLTPSGWCVNIEDIEETLKEFLNK